MKTVLLFAVAVLLRADSSPHKVRFVTVAKDVKLEILDWGGSGRPLVFLAGMGGTGHVFDTFAPKFTTKYHVYAFTRRGFGESSKPSPTPANYSARRLGDDVLAVMSALKLERPVIAGHSLAGAEMSSVGSRYPEKVAGLVYLDAGYGYAYYDPVHGDVWLDMMDLRKRVDELESGGGRSRKSIWNEMLADVTKLEGALRQITKDMASMPEMPPSPAIARAVQFGAEKFTAVPVPILAIFALHDDDVHAVEQAAAFEKGLPSAHVVRLKNADHFVFRSNEADVLREMNSFLAKAQ